MQPQPIDDFDPSLYVCLPRLDAPSLIALGRQLLAAAPADLPKPVQACKRALLAELRRFEAGYQAAQTEESSQPKRPVDLGADNSWSCFRARLEAYAALDPERVPAAARAGVLAQRLFPSGLLFTQLEYGAQWAEASWRIALIADEGLEPELRRLCGDVFLDELLYWHKEYGKMVGVVAARREVLAPRPRLHELRRRAGQAVVAWQAQLVALHLAGHPGARAALRPTDVYREKLAAAPVPRDPAEPTPVPAPAPAPTPTPAPAPTPPPA